MSELHKTMIESAEEKVLTGYLAGLKVARDDVSHVSSATVNVLQGWIDEAEKKLESFTAGKSSGASASGGAGGVETGSAAETGPAADQAKAAA